MRIESPQRTGPGSTTTPVPQDRKRASPLRGMSFEDQEAALAPPGPTAEAPGQAPPALTSAPGSGGPGATGLAVDAKLAKAHARELAGHGLREEIELTDQVFFRLFPWLAGVKLAPKSKEASAWLEVRTLAVRPVLEEPPPDKEEPSQADDAKTPTDDTKKSDGGGSGSKKTEPPPPAPVPTPVTPDVGPGPAATLSDSVGKGGENRSPDVAWVTNKLEQAGVPVAGSGESELGAAIKTYETRALNRSKSTKSKVSPGDYVHSALLSGARPRPIDVADPGPLVASSQVPEVIALRHEVAELRLFRDGIQTDQGEEGGAKAGTDAGKRDELVARIGQLRAQLKSMSLADVAPEEARAIRAWGFRQINELSPYYSQGRNANILEGESTRTCNLTSLAMTLEAMGISAANYTGDVALLEQIRSASTKDGGSTKKELDKAWGQNEEKQGLGGLRMPDFLQLVAVAHEMEKGKSLSKALAKAWNSILSPESLRTYATKFGVNAWLRYGAGSEKGKSKGQVWQETLGAELDAGHQVVILLPGHFVRLQAVTEEGLIVDDPAKGTKKDRPMDFKEVTSYKLVVLG